MITANYELPELLALDKEAKEKGILILNELGEDPGIDHFGTQMLLDEIRQDGGQVISLHSYGCGMPCFEHNRNPLGYKFSWSPKSLLAAAQTAAAYIKNGKKIKIPGDKLFENFWLIDLEELGTFETYPNRDCEKYIKSFGLKGDFTFYRGLLRFSGYCNNLRNIIALDLLDVKEKEIFEKKTYQQFTASLINTKSTNNLEHSVAQYLKVDDNADIIHCLKWLGFFEDRQIDIKEGTKQDILLDLMIKKMSYKPHEKDMIIVHIEILAKFPDCHKEKRLATMHAEGIPYGDSAMSRAVGLTVAITAKLILEGKLKAAGVHMPTTLPTLYKPVLEELSTLGFCFKCKTIQIS